MTNTTTDVTTELELPYATTVLMLKSTAKITTSPRGVYPTYSKVWVGVINHRLVLTATDRYVVIRAWVDSGASQGDATVPAVSVEPAAMLAALNAVKPAHPALPVRITFTPDGITLASEVTSITLPVDSGDVYPVVYSQVLRPQPNVAPRDERTPLDLDVRFLAKLPAVLTKEKSPAVIIRDQGPGKPVLFDHDAPEHGYGWRVAMQPKRVEADEAARMLSAMPEDV